MIARRRIVVVGVGSSGCAVADRISRSGTDDVLLVEAGAARADPTHIGVLPLTDPDRVWTHVDTEGTELPRGRGAGGSSTVNGAYFLRAHAADLAPWDETMWPADVVDRVHTALDGGDRGGGLMSVRRIADDELLPRARAFEAAMRRHGYDDVTGVWPRPGIVRVRVNAKGSTRWTAADALLDEVLARPGVRMRTGSTVDRVEIDSATVRSVVFTDGSSVRADVVVLCAGTIGSATVAARSGVASTMPLAEHRELLVRSRAPSDRTPPGAVLQTVVHTVDGYEIRCYERDFADNIAGVPPSGPAIGVAAMRAVGDGSIAVGDHGVAVDLGRPDAAATARMRQLAQECAAVLEGPDFAGLVEPGSTTVDETLSTSHHAWGALPMGWTADWAGRIRGVDGLWVADAAALPTPLSSGPHATVMMAASVIGHRVAAVRV